MDERTLETAMATTDRLEKEAIAQLGAVKTYSVIVLGRDGNKPFTVKAANADERAGRMVQAGVNLRNDEWAAGYKDHNRVDQICGNSAAAKDLITQHLRRR